MTDALGVLAASWGVVMAVSPLLQMRRMLQRRSSADVSITYLSVLQVGFMLWILYGWALGNSAIMVPNGVALVVGALTIAIAVRYRNPQEGLAADLSPPEPQGHLSHVGRGSSGHGGSRSRPP